MDTHRHMIYLGAVHIQGFGSSYVCLKTTSSVFSFEPSLTSYGRINLSFM